MIFTPASYQEDMINWLMTNQRAALFCGMSLGKTACTLQAFDYLYKLEEAKRMLVIAPLRVATLTWPNEIEQFDDFRWMRYAVLRKKDGWKALRERSAQVYLANWEAIPKLVEEGNFSCFDVIVFDELTKAKNPSSKRVNALRPYLHKIPRRWGLTGTPTPNSLMELFAQVRLLDDGERFGRSHDRFKRTYFYPTDYMEYNWAPLPGSEEKLYGKLANLALTMRTSDYLDIPDTVVEDIPVTLPDDVWRQYKQMVKDLLLLIGESEVLAPNAAALTNKLLQMTGGAVYDSEKDPAPVFIHDCKIQALHAYCKANPGENMLFVCNYRHEMDRLEKAFPGAWRWDRGDPERTLAAWNEQEVPALICHPKSMAHGLNMQFGGRTVVWYSPTYSREDYDQVNARLARRGQGQVTRVVRLLVPGSIDDAVVETLRAKGATQGALLQALTNLRKIELYA